MRTFAIGGMRTSFSENAEGCKDEKVFFITKPQTVKSCVKQITGKSGEPLTQTDSAKRTRIGRAFSLCFLAGDSSVDFLPFVQ